MHPLLWPVRYAVAYVGLYRSWVGAGVAVLDFGAYSIPNRFLRQKGRPVGKILRSFRALCLMACLVEVSVLSAAAQAQGKPANMPGAELWANLQGNFDSSKLKVGDTISAKVRYDWAIAGCTVWTGTILTGKIVELKEPSATAKTSEVSLRFEADCGDGKSVPMNLIAALYATDEGDKSQMDTYNAMPSGSKLSGGMRSGVAADLVPTPSSGANPLPPVKVGQVTGIRHLTLGVASEIQPNSTLSTTDKHLRLADGTRLAFRLATAAR